jgi:hypothetical protein
MKNKVVQVTGKELIDSISGEELLTMAIVKMIQEGTPWREVGKNVEVLSWEIHKALKSGVV